MNYRGRSNAEFSRPRHPPEGKPKKGRIKKVSGGGKRDRQRTCGKLAPGGETMNCFDAVDGKKSEGNFKRGGQAFLKN